MRIGQFRRELSLFSDVLLAVLCYMLVLDWHVGGPSAAWYVELIPVICGVWWFLSATLRREVPYRLGGVAAEIRDTLAVNIVGGLIIACLSLLTKHLMVSRLVLIAFPALTAAASIALRLATRTFLAYWRSRGHDVRHVLIAGPAASSRRLLGSVVRPEAGLQPIGLLVPERESQLRDGQNPPVLGTYADLPEILHDRVVDQVAVTAGLDEPGLRGLIDVATREGKSVWLVLDAFSARLMGQPGPGHIVELTPERNSYSLGLKRTLDVAVALVLLLLSSGIVAVCALLIKLEDPRSPVLFRQQRVGLHGRRFTCYKLRTMVPDAERRRQALLAQNEMDGPVFKMRNDPRITRTGQVLRKYSLDELPQLWNVLVGDMSLVGPRPPLPAEVSEYKPEFRRRLAFRPGLTCLWQISGRNAVDFEHWMELDLRYVDNWSFWMDLAILIKTIPVVLFGSGM